MQQGTSQSHRMPGRKSDVHLEETSILGKARAETCLERLLCSLACLAAGRSLEQRMDTVQSERGETALLPCLPCCRA